VPAPDEPELVRHTVAIPAERYELAMAELDAAFPDGFEEEEEDGARILLSTCLPVGERLALPAGYVAVETPVPAGWREGWRAFHRPVVLGGFWIGPPWSTGEAPGGAELVVIEPGQAFGTGAHGSTRATIELLLELPPGGPLLDIGCGSGVLSIVAARLGYEPVSAIDLDALAVSATRENASRNGVAVAATQMDVLRDPLPATPFALANLQHEILVPLFARDGLPDSIVVSGLLAEEPFAPAGWRSERVRVRDGWRAEHLLRVG
jgi:ribosomal protein L11 methyltransferase